MEREKKDPRDLVNALVAATRAITTFGITGNGNRSGIETAYAVARHELDDFIESVTAKRPTKEHTNA